MALDYNKAKCKGVDPALFFETFEAEGPVGRLQIIANYCGICEQRQECKKLAENTPHTWGLFGGEYFKNGQRVNIMKMRRSQAITLTAPPKNLPSEVGAASLA